MFALFAGNSDENLNLGIDGLAALTPTLEEAQGALAPLVDQDTGIDWAHVADLELASMPKVATWDRGRWEVLDEPTPSPYLDPRYRL